ncbi:MAG TPA: ABC transporter ATP-binding protein, partial [Polyangiaceae bacterium]|nr:ABC transporter ATP-binding protein [Polyangiaceae bacterium]
TIAYEGDGRFLEYAGGYGDYVAQKEGADDAAADVEAAERAEPPKGKKPRTPRPPKRTFKEERELEALPAIIEALEQEQASLHEKMADPAFYQGQGAEVAAATARLEALEAELETAYARWTELEEIGGGE